MIDFSKYNFSLEHYGEAYCKPNHNFGPGVKTSYMIVFVLDGTGEFTLNNVTKKLGKRDVFMVEPHVVHQYKADQEDPWHYAWISFSADHFQEDYLKIKTKNGVRQVRDLTMISKYISRLRHNENFQNTGFKSVRDDALIKLFLSEFCAEDLSVVSSQKETVVQRIKEYIENNYFEELTIEGIADQFSFNRSYMCRLFKEVEGKSPKEYMIDYKMSVACNLLLESSLTVENISNSIGYKDPFNFSKMFKKRIGLPPQEYKKYMEKTLKQYF